MGHFYPRTLELGQSFAIFHISGNFPDARERLNNGAKGGAMLLAVAFSMKADMPSGPLALLTFVHEGIGFIDIYSGGHLSLSIARAPRGASP